MANFTKKAKTKSCLESEEASVKKISFSWTFVCDLCSLKEMHGIARKKRLYIGIQYTFKRKSYLFSYIDFQIRLLCLWVCSLYSEHTWFNILYAIFIMLQSWCNIHVASCNIHVATLLFQHSCWISVKTTFNRVRSLSSKVELKSDQIIQSNPSITRGT